MVDFDKRQVKLGGRTVALTPTEFRLLAALIERAGQAVAEEELRREVWGLRGESDAAVVRRYIWLLRRKLESDPTRPDHILTVRGYGYRLGTAPFREEDAPPPPKDRE